VKGKVSRLELERELKWRRWSIDPVAFLTELWYINQVGKGYANIELWDHQGEMLDTMIDIHNTAGYLVCLKARQIGMTTLATGLAFWSAFFHSDRPWLMVSVGEKEAADTLSTKFVQPYLRLPEWVKKRGPKIVADTQELFSFDNGSSMLAVPTTSKAGRSKAVFGVLLDESAFAENAEEVFAAVDPMTYGPIFVFSTANGMGNWFHGTWLDSQVPGSIWESMFYPWTVVPGRDQDWYDERRMVYRGRDHLMFQEFPANPGEAFLKSGRTAFDVEQLQAVHDWKEPEFKLDLTILNTLDADSVAASRFPPDELRDLELWVWEEPKIVRHENGVVKQQPNYVVAVDVAEGLEHGDFSTISVRDANTNHQVAAAKCHIPIYNLGAAVEAVGYWYHSALVVVERNNFGLVPLQHLQQHAYPRLYRMDSIAQQKRGDRTPRYGWHTNSVSKPKMVNDMNLAFANDHIEMHDQRFLAETTTFIANGKGGFEAADPNHDDLVMSEMIAQQGVLDVGEYPITWIDDEPGPMTLGELFDQDIAPDSAGAALATPLGDRPFARGVIRSFEIPV